MKKKYLLIEDLEDIGRAGELIVARAGFARNYLIPQKKALVATPHTLRMQTKLQEERTKRAVEDRQNAESLAEKLKNISLTISVKVDPDGNMYGSVGIKDIIELFSKEGFSINRRQIELHKPIKKSGSYSMVLKLGEGVTCDYHLDLVADPS